MAFENNMVVAFAYELKDATRILVQISNLQMIESMKNKIKQTDIYIKPDISAYNVVSFDDGAKIIQAGELAALQHIQQLNIYSNINYKKTADKHLYFHNV